MSTPRQTHSDYRHFHTITTRRMDNDVYGHASNVVYYSYFDTVANVYLIGQGVLNPEHSNIIGLVIETQCSYFAPLLFSDPAVTGLHVACLGNTSVRYEVSLFRGDTQGAAAQGHFVYVCVDCETRRPVALPDALRAVLESLAPSIAA